jgi:hypothetical protein
MGSRRNDSSRVSAQEDTTAHTGYSMIQREIASRMRCSGI